MHILSDERMCTILVSRFACQVKVWLDKLIMLDMTPLDWLGRKPQHKQTNNRYKTIGYNMTIMRQIARIVVNPVLVDNFGSFFNCIKMSRASDWMVTLSESVSEGWRLLLCCLWSGLSWSNLWLTFALASDCHRAMFYVPLLFCDYLWFTVMFYLTCLI